MRSVEPYRECGRRWRGWALAVLACSLWGAPAAAQQGQQQRLIPANFQQTIDSQGFLWDVGSQGHIGNGTNSCFGSAEVLTVNGNSFRVQNGLMTPDGREYVLTGTVANVQITRRIKVDVKAAAVRYVELIHNPTPAPISVPIQIQTQLGRNQAQAVVTDGGGPGVGVLGKNDTGIVAYSMPSTSQATVVFHLAGARSKVKPIVQVQNLMQFFMTYQVTVPAGKSVAILHGIAQRNLAAPPDKKAAADLLKPFASRAWTADLPSDVRRALVNSGGVGLSGLAETNLLVSLESFDVQPGPSDVLAVGQQTRLHGTASGSGLAIETRYGTAKIALDDVVALAGPRFTGSVSRVLLRDGQVLSGKLTAKELSFTMNTGLPVRIAPENLDRLVMHAGGDTPELPADVFATLETIDGDRLALVRSEGQTFTATTPWGQRRVALESIRRWMAADGNVGCWLVLEDGSRLFSFVEDRPLTVKTLAFGPREFPPVEIRSLMASDQSPGEPKDTADLTSPHLVLAGENLLVGRVDLPVIHLVAGGQTIPIPPDQVRSMRKVSSQDDSPGEGGPQFEVELWDGGTASGSLRETVLPVRCGEGACEVLVRDVAEIRVPAPSVPEGLRVKIANLIRDLGHPEYARRQAAQNALAEMGHLARLPLEETLSQTSDPEVRRSVESLLEELK